SSQSASRPDRPDRPGIGGPVAVGLAVLALFFGLLGGWAGLAPLTSAAVASGVVKVDSNRKTVQHLEGGIIAALVVQNGARVAAGDVLIRLDAAQARAAWALLQGQHDALAARAARLAAERDGAAAIAVDAGLAARRDDPAVAAMLAGQVDILHQRQEQLEAEIAGRRAQLAAALRQKALLGEEIADVAVLVDKGLERRTRLLGLQRQQANLEGVRGEQLGLIARARQQIGEAELQIINRRNSQMDQVVAALAEARARLGELKERLAASRDVLVRRAIVSPIAGTVVNLRFFTPGGVIRPGDPIMDIVPLDDQLVIEAQIRPIDIDVVRPGLAAQVRLTAFKQRTTPTLEGRVVYVSADRLIDAASGAAYFTARIEIPAAALARLVGVALYPGMPAEVMVVTGRRTALEYLLAPLTESFGRAFREE
ncbi:MAG: HlyD family type I secretion periplasmic adaptor subunit, partial [Kiloniellales bacterium]